MKIFIRVTANLSTKSCLVILASAITLLCACAALPGRQTRSPVVAVESAVPGVPIPVGSKLDANGLFEDREGVVMAFYTHRSLVGEEVLSFYDMQMPIWGWTVDTQDTGHTLQRAYARDGVPVFIGVDKRTTGCSFSILKGAHGDWRYLAPLREQR